MLQIIEQYEFLSNHFSDLIDMSGYRLDYLAKEIGITPNNMYGKKRRSSFSNDEMKKLLKIIWNEKIEDYFLAEAIKEGEVSGYLSEQETSDMFAKI